MSNQIKSNKNTETSEVWTEKKGLFLLFVQRLCFVLLPPTACIAVNQNAIFSDSLGADKLESCLCPGFGVICTLSLLVGRSYSQDHQQCTTFSLTYLTLGKELLLFLNAILYFTTHVTLITRVFMTAK